MHTIQHTALHTILYVQCYVLYCVLYCMPGYILQKSTLYYTLLCKTMLCSISVMCELPLQSTYQLTYYVRERNYVISCCAAYVVLRIYSGKHCVIMLHYMFLG